MGGPSTALGTRHAQPGGAHRTRSYGNNLRPRFASLSPPRSAGFLFASRYRARNSRAQVRCLHRDLLLSHGYHALSALAAPPETRPGSQDRIDRGRARPGRWGAGLARTGHDSRGSKSKSRAKASNLRSGISSTVPAREKKSRTSRRAEAGKRRSKVIACKTASGARHRAGHGACPAQWKARPCA